MNGFRNISISWRVGAEDLASGPRGLSPPLAKLCVQASTASPTPCVVRPGRGRQSGLAGPASTEGQ